MCCPEVCDIYLSGMSFFLSVCLVTSLTLPFSQSPLFLAVPPILPDYLPASQLSVKPIQVTNFHMYKRIIPHQVSYIPGWPWDCQIAKTGFEFLTILSLPSVFQNICVHNNFCLNRTSVYFFQSSIFAIVKDSVLVYFLLLC